MKLHEPFTCFVDRSLGRGLVVEALRAAKFDVHHRRPDLRRGHRRRGVARRAKPQGLSFVGWLRAGLPVYLYVFARCWLIEGRARERGARGLSDKQ
ncbi:hypothetical protein [Sorangium sp. So ce1335]|uniref:hypothetical protein n=1 Tax=Sorangium sp. So ce1335 TaxID=3133335 RepID=UPI003F63AC7A